MKNIKDDYNKCTLTQQHSCMTECPLLKFCIKIVTKDYAKRLLLQPTFASIFKTKVTSSENNSDLTL